MKRTGFLYDERYLLHKTSSGHPECPERLTAIYKGIEEAGLIPRLTPIRAVRANQKWIEIVHHVNYIMRFEEACLLGMDELDYPDNQMCSDTYETAFLAVGGILHTIDMIMEDQIDNAFCAIRPPGHHAELGKAMGFCYFNNIAIAARYLQDNWDVRKVAIIDFDVHHGNGSQHLFESDPSVFYYSIHEHPSFAYPGTGRDFEKGNDAGYGYTLNCPVLPGQGDREYKELMEKELPSAMEFFEPDFILLSTGFDAHIDDDMSGISLSTQGFSWIMEIIMKQAEKYTSGKLVSILEGGYCLERLPELAKNHVEILLRG
ncbi:Histone deacetylase domain-containing protein [Desulfonema limicola]|uniref:Histone deacetylase domain-containing protein n=1 Tax=Desulfonema limicola TaxID=45656 RepID=A0A975GFS3_9BACT|nr:histone deacetylase [Desulfonema limicola]QTA79557.1 Histone deacetylase domain-containing protein [Desulfonema limicola]